MFMTAGADVYACPQKLKTSNYHLFNTRITKLTKHTDLCFEFDFRIRYFCMTDLSDTTFHPSRALLKRIFKYILISTRDSVLS